MTRKKNKKAARSSAKPNQNHSSQPAKASSAKHPPLQILEQKLAANGYQTNFIPKGDDEDILFDNLLIILDEEESEEPAFLMQAFFVEDMMKAHDPELPAEETPNFATLQFILELPVEWPEMKIERSAEALLLLNACSQRIPIGHFTLDEHSLVYTYSLLADSQRLESKVILAALDLMSFFIPPMTTLFDDFMTQNLSFDSALEILDQRVLEA